MVGILRRVEILPAVGHFQGVGVGKENKSPLNGPAPTQAMPLETRVFSPTSSSPLPPQLAGDFLNRVLRLN